MQNGTITYYSPYYILSGSNLVVNVCIVEYKFNPGRIQWGAQGARAPAPLPPLISRVVVPAPSTPECRPLPI